LEYVAVLESFASVTLALLFMTVFSRSIGFGLTAAGPSRAVDRETLVPVSIELVAGSEISDSLLNRMCAETDAIWRTAGVRFNWHRSEPNETLARERLEVTIDDRRYVPAGSHEALGWITFNSDGPAKSIHLSLAGTEDLLRRTTTLGNTTITGHDIVVGRALGRALAHELGHYFLRSKTHASRGLMRATWPADEPFAISRKGFELTAQERNEVLQRLRD
jgi:hypothetical protein